MNDPSPFAILDESAGRVEKKRAKQVASIRTVNVLLRAVSIFGQACRKQTPAVMEKFLFFGGLASVVCGCSMIYRPLGPLVGGGLAVWLGMLISVERNEPRP